MFQFIIYANKSYYNTYYQPFEAHTKEATLFIVSSRVRAQRYNNFLNYKICYIFVSKILRLLLCSCTQSAFLAFLRVALSLNTRYIL